jgi:hypothetical protein
LAIQALAVSVVGAAVVGGDGAVGIDGVETVVGVDGAVGDDVLSTVGTAGAVERGSSNGVVVAGGSVTAGPSVGCGLVVDVLGLVVDVVEVEQAASGDSIAATTAIHGAHRDRDLTGGWGR